MFNYRTNHTKYTERIIPGMIGKERKLEIVGTIHLYVKMFDAFKIYFEIYQIHLVNIFKWLC